MTMGTIIAFLVASFVASVAIIVGGFAAYYDMGAPGWVAGVAPLIAVLVMYPATMRWERWDYHRRQAQNERGSAGADGGRG